MRKGITVKVKAGFCGLLIAGFAVFCGASETELQKGVQLLHDEKIEEAEKIFLKLAEKNNAEAFNYLGKIEIQIRQNMKKGAEYHKKASDLGNLNSRYIYGIMLASGIGCKQDEKAAYVIMKELADKTQYQGACYETGRLMIVISKGSKDAMIMASAYLAAASEGNKGDEYENGHPKAQLLLGCILQELNYLSDSSKFLELAALQGEPDGWLKLGVNLSQIENQRDAKRAILCFRTSYKLRPHSDAAFNIGLLEATAGNYEEGLKWMKIAADMGNDSAKQFLKDKVALKQFKEIKKKFSSNFAHLALKSDKNRGKKYVPENTTKQQDMISEKPARQYKINGWNYDYKTTNERIDENLFFKLDHVLGWAENEFTSIPGDTYLRSTQDTLKEINAHYRIALVNSFKKAGYQKLSEKEQTEFLKKNFNKLLASHCTNEMWKINDNLYLNINTATAKYMEVVHYQFFVKMKNEKFFSADLTEPPGEEDAAMIAGIVQNDPACFNDLALKYERGEMDMHVRADFKAEAIFKQLIEANYAPAAYNLAVYYKKRGKAADAAKYFKLAEEMKRK